MSYDHWKTTEDEPSIEWGECDCCGRRMPLDSLTVAWPFGGIETWACPECRGDEPLELPDISPITTPVARLTAREFANVEE